MSEKPAWLLTVPEEYRREDGYVVLTGNPRCDRSFSIVMLSCRQAKYGALRTALDKLLVRYGHLSLHLVPFVCETYALLRGSMPRQTWLWDEVIEPLKDEVGVNDVDVAIFNVEPLKLRWLHAPPTDQEVRPDVRLLPTRQAASKLLHDEPLATLIGNGECERDLVYVLVYLRPGQTRHDERVLGALANDERVRDLFNVRRGEREEKHLIVGGNFDSAISWPIYEGPNAMFGRADLLRRIGALAVFHTTSEGHGMMRELFDWRIRFAAEYDVEIDIMPVVALHEGPEYRT